MVVIGFLMVVFDPPLCQAAEPLRGMLLEDEPDIRISSQAHEGSTIAVAGRKIDQATFVANPFIALFDARTGEEIWRDVTEKNLKVSPSKVAIAQNRVCAAWNTQNPSTTRSNLFIQCYGTHDGSKLWGVEFEPPSGGPALLEITSGGSVLTLSGKALVFRSTIVPGFSPVVILLDPSDGSAKSEGPTNGSDAPTVSNAQVTEQRVVFQTPCSSFPIDGWEMEAP